MKTDAGFRPATAGHVPALEAVVLANEPGLTAGAHQAYLAHLVARATVQVATSPDGAVLGFAVAVDTGRARHLADLYVLPSAQGEGLGGELMRFVMGDAWPRTTFASDDPRALPLYVRAGMAALHPNLYLAGDPRRLDCPPGHRVAPTTFERMAELEQAWAGVDRRPELPYWTATPAARAFVVTVDGRDVATGFARPRKVGEGRWLDHVVASPEADGTAALVAALAAQAGAAELAGACLLGPSPAVRIVLDAGFRIVDRDIYLASDPTLVDPTREIVNTGLL